MQLARLARNRHRHFAFEHRDHGFELQVALEARKVRRAGLLVAPRVLEELGQLGHLLIVSPLLLA